MSKLLLQQLCNKTTINRRRTTSTSGRLVFIVKFVTVNDIGNVQLPVITHIYSMICISISQVIGSEDCL